MKKQRRVYPVKRNCRRLLNALLLTVSAVLIVSGVFFETESRRFSLMTETLETPLPMPEAFDETHDTLEIDLQQNSWYALQVGVFENLETAQQAAQAFQRRGAAGYIWQDGRYRVLAAVYPSKEDAQNVREQLRDQHSIDSYLYDIEYPFVRMRLTGMRGQLEILQAAFEHAKDLALGLNDLSISVDRQELGGSEIKASLTKGVTQAEIVVLRLEQRFPKPYHATVQALIECFADYSNFVSGFTGQENAVETGMKLKYQTFVTLQKIHEIYQTLQDI